MRYRMLVTDLDYTCLDERHEIPEVNLRAAKKAVEEGIIFAIATGRGKAAAQVPVSQLAPNAPVILQNGMNIYDFRKSLMIREHLVDTEVAIKAVAWGDKRGVIPVISVGDRHYVSKRGGKKIDDLERLEGVPTIETGNMEQFLVKERESIAVANVLYICEPEERDMIAAEAALVFPEMNVIVSGPPFVEFLNKDASKGHALGEICELLGIGVSEVVAVGDAQNDADMLRMAGMSYAVANADEDIKRLVKKVCSRSNNDGVLPEVLQDAFGIEI